MKKTGLLFLGKILIALFVGGMAVLTLYPVIYAVLGSLKTNFELTLGGGFLPKKPMFENYVFAFKKANFTGYTFNSLTVSGLSVIFALVTSSLAGYAIARHEFPGKKLLMVLYTGMLFISLGAVTLYPQYKLMHSLGLTGNLMGLALVLTGGQVTNLFLTMSFVKSIPGELDESALMDGCSFFRIYWSIILPLIRPVLGIVALFAFRNAWNDYITSLIFTMSRTQLRTLTVGLVSLRYSANAAAEWHIMAAGASIALLPILILFIFTNKQFISGLTAGSVKG